MDFTASSVECWSADDVETVFLGEEARELALTLCGARGAGHTVEWNDQSNVCPGAVRSARLKGRSLQIVLLAKAARQLGEPAFGVELACDDEALAEVRQRLSAILGERFTVTPGPAPKAAAPCDVSQVRYLNLEGKNLKTLPEYVRQMTALEVVKLARNPQLDFRAVCEVLGGLPAVKELTFTTDEPVPESMGELRQLEALSLDGFTRPQVLPESFGRLTKLKRLLMMGEGDVILPESFAELEALEALNMRVPSWQAPAGFHRLSRLTSLDLANCRFAAGVPEEMAGMAAVETVYLAGDEALRLLPVVARMPKVTTLQLSCAVVPADLALCQRIEELVIWGAGEIPAFVGRLTELRTLVMTLGDFETLPESIGELAKLTLLNVGENEKLRELPESVGRLTELRCLFLHENPKLRRVPASVRELARLEQVRGTEGMEGVPASWAQLVS